MRVCAAPCTPCASPAITRAVSKPVRAAPHRDLRRAHVLIARTHELIGLGKVDPNLEAVLTPAFAHHALRGHLGVHHAGAGGHPLHVAGTNLAAMAGRIGVLILAFDHIRHGLETAMRMIGRADRFAGRVLHRPEFVDQQKRIDLHARLAPEMAGAPKSRRPLQNPGPAAREKPCVLT